MSKEYKISGCFTLEFECTVEADDLEQAEECAVKCYKKGVFSTINGLSTRENEFGSVSLSDPPDETLVTWYPAEEDEEEEISDFHLAWPRR